MIEMMLKNMQELDNSIKDREKELEDAIIQKGVCKTYDSYKENQGNFLIMKNLIEWISKIIPNSFLAKIKILEEKQQENFPQFMKTFCEILSEFINTFASNPASKYENFIQENDKIETEIIKKQKQLNYLIEQIERIKSEKIIIEKSQEPIKIPEYTFIEHILKRAAKISLFLTNTKSITGSIKSIIPQIGENQIENWKFIDIFTKQVRIYIRKCEESKIKVDQIKKEKSKFINYVEKEVDELRKSWNLMEQQKSKMTDLFEQVAENNKKKLELESDIEKYIEQREIIEKQINSLQENKMKLINEIDNIRGEAEIAENDLKNLQQEQHNIKQNITKLELQKLEIEQQISDSNAVISENNLSQISLQISHKEKQLLEINNELKQRQQECIKYKGKVSKYKNRIDELKNELATMQNFSDTHCLFNYNNSQ